MKRIIAAVLMLMLVLFCMASCFTLTNPPGDNTPGDNDGGNNGGNDSGNSGNNGGNNDYQEPVDYGSATVFAPGNRVQVIATSTADSIRIKEALDEFLVYNGKGGATVGNLYSQNEKLEVLVNIEDIDESSETMLINFDDRKTIYEFSMLDELEHAYAITVHKSQGSEYPVVILPLGFCPPMLRTRNLLYTAVTRAARMIILVGRQDVLAEMVENDRHTLRSTYLLSFIREVFEA
jgi:ATP-dependent exoDNAse (exonuclease V) alpha subunit